ncbi:uncharacterized mitochondrial protein AtMg00810-like [Vicia villosa]|uniref:uncharacterized mitochondrial protein AtMg00810-like n=1 Tax=Vicia villosa TaxID=3911 RepID=UPI00273C6696|nr:uncharacterized mitochondrial protein AtMg00810-like [Vicia villosa]
MRSENDPNLYLKRTCESELMVVCLYVDDMIYFGSTKLLIGEFKFNMMKTFEMRDLGLLQYFLGLEVKQGKYGIFIFQNKYATDLLKKFQLSNCVAAATPMNINEKLLKEDGSGKTDPRWFRSLVGGLNYLTHTRPDISFCVSVVSRYMHSPTKKHFGAAKRILRYFAGTVDYGIRYAEVPNFKLTGFIDSDWAGSIDDRKSTSGNVFSFGSGAVTWSSKKQETVALSTSSSFENVFPRVLIRLMIWVNRVCI